MPTMEACHEFHDHTPLNIRPIFQPAAPADQVVRRKQKTYSSVFSCLFLVCMSKLVFIFPDIEIPTGIYKAPMGWSREAVIALVTVFVTCAPIFILVYRKLHRFPPGIVRGELSQSVQPRTSSEFGVHRGDRSGPSSIYFDAGCGDGRKRPVGIPRVEKRHHCRGLHLCQSSHVSCYAFMTMTPGECYESLG